ncbi:MAG: hypothetical protein RIT81_14345 [Deltaproteobacteria bacterium]
MTSDGWRITTAAEDPFEDRPAAIDCIPQTVTVEGPALEIDTAACDYVTVVQPSVVDVRACDVLRATLAHAPLFFEEPAEAHVALYLGARALFDQRISIPADSDVYAIEVEAGEVIEAGTPVFFHVHNHGANNWFVTDVRLEP